MDAKINLNLSTWEAIKEIFLNKKFDIDLNKRGISVYVADQFIQLFGEL